MSHPSEKTSALPKPFRPNWLLRRLFDLLFSKTRVDPHWREKVEEASHQGVVVYILRSVSFMDFLLLDFFVGRFNLPSIRFVNKLGLWVFEPFGRGLRKFLLRKPISDFKWLEQVLKSGASPLLFLKKPPRLGRTSRKGEKLKKDFLLSLIVRQKEMEKPLILVSQTVLWSKQVPQKKGGWKDSVFGPSQWPGKLRTFFQFFFNFGQGHLQAGGTLNLKMFIEDHSDLADEELALNLKQKLLKGFEKDRAASLGPATKPLERLFEEVIRNPKVQKRIEAESKSNQVERAKIRKKAFKELRKMGANPTRKFIRLLYHPFRRFLNHTYDGLHVDQEGIEKVRKAAREGTVIFLPSHKSHMDYLLLTFVLYDHALSTPLVAAGENLRFWPLGPVLRRAGAFFIKRDFQGKKLYAALVEAYLRKILMEGHSVEFFIEGGRSRTGKLLVPQLGLLSMVVNIGLDLKKKVFFVPVSIGYERVIERSSYEEELQGKEKQTEGIGDLIRTSEVLLSKHGQVNIQFGEIFELRDVVEGFEQSDFRDRSDSKIEDKDLPPPHSLLPALSFSPSQSLSPSQRRAKVKQIAHRVIEQIHACTMVTPSSLIATALLVHRHRGISREELLYLASEILKRLLNDGVRPSPTLSQGTIHEMMLEQVSRIFIQDKLIELSSYRGSVYYKIKPGGRLGLEYYKNTISHFLIHRAVICTVLELHASHSILNSTLRSKYDKVLAYISPFFAEIPQDNFQSTLDGMCEQKELVQTGKRVRIENDRMLTMLQSFSFLLRSYWETYWVVLQSLDEALTLKPVSRKDWMRKTLAFGKRLFQTGVVECSESVTKPRLEQTLNSFRQRGFVKFEQQERFRVVLSEEFKTFGEEIRALLRIT